MAVLAFSCSLMKSDDMARLVEYVSDRVIGGEPLVGVGDGANHPRELQ